MNKIHTVKTWSDYYQAVVAGTKTFEIRKNDRDYQVGDAIVLQEFDPATQQYTLEMVTKIISYITDFPSGLREGYVVLGLHDFPQTLALTEQTQAAD